MAAPPVLMRFSARGSNGDQLELFRQGATVKTATNIIASNPSPVPIPVYNTGAVAVGDHLYLNGNSTKELVVTAVNVSGNSISANNVSDTTIAAQVGNRLVDITAIPILYVDPNGTIGASTPYLIGASGEISGYVRPLRFDYKVNTLIYLDATGSFVMRT